MPGNYVLEIYVKKSEWNGSNRPVLKVKLKWGTYDDTAYSYFGGLRIKEIKNYDSGTDLKTQRNYTYLDENSKESGDYINLPLFKKREYNRFIRYFGSCSIYGSALNMVETGSITMSSSAVIPLVSVSGSNIAYTRVREDFYDYNNPLNTMSKVEKYSFEHPILSFPTAPVGEDWVRGLLLQSTTGVAEDSFTYAGGENNYVLNAYDMSTPPTFTKWVEACSGAAPWHIYDTSSLDYQSYQLITNTRKNLIEKTHKMDNVSTTTQYEYGSASLVSIEKTTSSIGDNLQTKYFYPFDIEMSDEPYVQDLIDKNMIDKPIDTQTFKNTTKLSEQKTEYGSFVSDVLGNPNFLPKYIYANKGSSAIVTNDRMITFDSYDEKGNITQYTIQNGTPVSIIWGYNQTMPIAKIENATNLEIEALLGISLGAIDESNVPNNIRALLSNTMVTTYTYLPLVGVSTITDPKGQRQTFTYDSFGRLEFVKDNEGNTLSANEYHYRTQN